VWELFFVRSIGTRNESPIISPVIVIIIANGLAMMTSSLVACRARNEWNASNGRVPSRRRDVITGRIQFRVLYRLEDKRPEAVIGPKSRRFLVHPADCRNPFLLSFIAQLLTVFVCALQVELPRQHLKAFRYNVNYNQRRKTSSTATPSVRGFGFLFRFRCAEPMRALMRLNKITLVLH
jgi:hypothetical protein